MTYEGTLREPRKSFINDLVDKHAAQWINKDSFKEHIIKERLIKIPDVYRVEMHFKSLLPANFNNFLYSYSENISHLVKYKDKVADKGIGTLLGTAMNKFAGHLSEEWDKN